MTIPVEQIKYENTDLPDIIELRDILQIYKTKKGEAVVIKDLNFLVEDKPNQGQFVVILGVSGCGKCVAEGTWVRFSEGLRRIEDVVSHRDVEIKKCQASVLLRNKLEPLSHTYYGGIRNTIKITTKEGYELEGSYDHPINTNSFEKPCWVKLRDLKKGDKIFFDNKNSSDFFIISIQRITLPAATKKFMIIRNRIRAYKKMGLSNLKIVKLVNLSPMQVGRIVRNLVKNYKFKVPLFLSKKMAYYLGLMAGNGSIKEKCSFTNEDVQVIDFFIKHTKKFFNIDCHVNDRRGSKVKFIRPGELDRYSDWMRKVFGGVCSSDTKDVPLVIRRAPFSFQLEFLRGLFDTDGSATDGRVEISLNSKKLIDFICNMLSVLGIEYNVKKRKKSYRVFTIKSNRNKVLFRLKRKLKKAQYKIEKFPSGKLCEIIKIEKKKNILYDLTNPHSQSFIANGFLVHNSTLLRFIAALQKPTSGDILIKGKPQFPDFYIPMVFQKYSSLENRSVLDNVALGLEIAGISKKERHEKAMAIIKKVGLLGHEKKYAKYPNLSGGQLQRVAIARCLLTNPDILLMDEPFGALDAHTRFKMQELLAELWLELQLTCIFVTHDIPEAVFLGDEIVLMRSNPGQIVEKIQIPFGLERPKELKREKRFTDLVFYIEDRLTKLGELNHPEKISDKLTPPFGELPKKRSQW